MAATIYQLTRKNVPFDWNEECRNAFYALKQELCTNRFLTYFNPKLPSVVACDARPVGLGAKSNIELALIIETLMHCPENH